jgi:predicted ester cyclase
MDHREATMLTRSLFQRVLEDLDTLEPDQFTRHLTADFAFTMPGAELHGPTAYYDLCAEWSQAFPDLGHHLDSFMADGDEYCAEIRITGSHLGRFGSLAPTGRSFVLHTATLGRFTGDRMAGRRVYVDSGDLLRQLGQQS